MEAGAYIGCRNKGANRIDVPTNLALEIARYAPSLPVRITTCTYSATPGDRGRDLDCPRTRANAICCLDIYADLEQENIVPL